MYNEEYEEKGYPILGIIFRVIIIAIIILLLIWLIPKIIGPTNKTNSKENETSNSSTNCNMGGINALSSQIFSNNIDKMKDAAISYYTTDRLPEEVGQSDTMTLSDMIGKKLIIALIDKNNKAVNVEKSYVKITKTEDEYILKVNIKDSEKEDYILVHLGCYSYCKSDICEKKGKNYENVPIKASKNNTVVPIKQYNPARSKEIKETYSCEYKNGKYYNPDGIKVSELTYIISCQAPKCEKVNGYYFDKNGNNVTKRRYEISCTSKPTTHKCEYNNGKYYDKNGNVVSHVNYIISCQAPKCEKVDGYYFDKNGNNVTKRRYEISCTSKPTTHKCEYNNGKYYDKNGDVVSHVNYIISCQAPKCEKVDGYYFDKNGNNVTKRRYEISCTSKPTTHKCEYNNGKYYDKNGNVVSHVNYIISCQAPKCEIVNGYYFNKNGKNVSKNEYEKSCNTKPTEYIYEYSKTTNTEFSSWSNWSNWQKTDCNTQEINCDDSETTCLYKLQTLKRKEKIGTYQKSYSRSRNIVKQTGSYIEKSCSKYNYIEINKTIYATTTTTYYTTINTITSGTKATTGSWKYNGRASYSNPPRDSNTTHYIFVGADYSYCNDTCSTLPNYYYDAYTYTGSLRTVSSTTAPGTTTSTTTEYKASCGDYVYKTIPIYSTITVTDKATREEPLYGDVCYQSTKNRKLISKGTTKTKWSKYNNTSLLNDGWEYTGRKKVK